MHSADKQRVMAKLSITLKIAGVSYPHEIDGSEEEIYRHAEREVNRLFAEGAGTSLLPKDRLALAAHRLAMDNVTLRAGRSPDAESERLAEIDRMLSDYLDNRQPGA